MFDAIAHPTLDGGWLAGRPGMDFDDFELYLGDHGLRGACAVGLPTVGGYEHEEFFRRGSAIKGVIPVGALTQIDADSFPGELRTLADIGYTCVKIHPRLLGWEPDVETLSLILRSASDAGLKVMYCSYYFRQVGAMPKVDPFWVLCGALDENPECQMLVVHGGGVRLLEYAELVRHSPELLLDLSLTFTKYQGSSLDLDIGFVLQSFDQRVCFGTDVPDVAVNPTLSRIRHLTENLSEEKASNVLHRNIERFFGLPVN